jgi:site-specific DNA-methyltransferase (adenine-specific)
MFFHVRLKTEARSVQSYYATKFFRFLVSLRKITQLAQRSVYTWVPIQTWDRQWTDEELYAKYGLTKSQIAYIESVIKPMNLGDGDE